MNNRILSILNSHIKNIIILFMGIIIVGLISFGVILDTHINDLNNQINANIEEYEEIDLEQLCRIAECTKVEVLKSQQIYINNKGILQPIEENIDTGIELHDAMYIVDDKLALYNDKTDAFFILDINKLIISYLKAIMIFAPLSLLVFVFPLLKSIR